MKDELFTYCDRLRPFLELRWQEKHLTWQQDIPDILSSFMCRYTSIFLQQVLAMERNINTIIVGGRPIRELHGTPYGKYGFIDRHHCWYDHCWLETKHLIIDLTADQFGDLPIIITPKRDRRYRANLDEYDPRLKYALIELSRTSDRWLQMWRSNNLEKN